MVTRSGSLATIKVSPGERIIVFGDIHGDLRTLEKGLAVRRPRDVVVFLGDYADRGPDGVEVIEQVETLLDRLPQSVVALKGNHESYSDSGEPLFSPCTLTHEAEKKRGSWEAYFPHFSRFVDRLSIAAIVPGETLFVHGGIHNSIESAGALEDPSASLESEIMWSDPVPHRGLSSSRRGAGHEFGPDISERVCRNLGVKRIVRSHEPRKAIDGPASEHDGRVITTSSTTVYHGDAFVLVFDPEMSVVDL